MTPLFYKDNTFGQFLIEEVVLDVMAGVVDSSETGMSNAFMKIEQLEKLVAELATLLTEGQQIQLAASLGFIPVVQTFTGKAPTP